MSFFAGNPFSTPVGQRIEQATDAALASENWTLNMEICDIINSTEDGAKDAIKAIRKRLQQYSGKSSTVVMYTLTVLETCVKNCGKRFHLLACNKEFVQELVKLIGPKNEPPTDLQEKVLNLIQSWADAFRYDSDLSGVVQVYTEMRQKGIEFPMTDLDAVAPIHTPQRSVPNIEPPIPTPVSPSMGIPISGSRTPSPAHNAESRSPPQAIGTVSLSPEQLAKLQSELDIVQGNMMVLSEMLSELTPGKEHPSDMQLLQELHDTCQAMKHRLVELIGKLNNDKITAELLHINDELNNVFLRYSRFENNRTQGTQNTPALAPESIDLLSGSPALQDLSLLDTSPTLEATKAPILLQQSEMKKADKEDSEFDMLAQSRNVPLEPSKVATPTSQETEQSVATPSKTLPPGISQSEREFDEMAAWLSDKPAGSATGATEESLTSGEFERFLAERAAAAEALPTVDNTRPGSAATTPRPHHQRQLNKESDTEGSLFAL